MKKSKSQFSDAEIFHKTPVTDDLLVYVMTITRKKKKKENPYVNLVHHNICDICDAFFELFNTILPNAPFLYPLKTGENIWFSDVFRSIEMEHWS